MDDQRRVSSIGKSLKDLKHKIRGRDWTFIASSSIAVLVGVAGILGSVAHAFTWAAPLVEWLSFKSISLAGLTVFPSFSLATPAVFIPLLAVGTLITVWLDLSAVFESKCPTR